MALILVMILSLLLLLIPLGIAAANEGALPLARLEVDRSAALAAADAGVDDYINRLNNNPNYWQQSIGSGTTPPGTPADGNQALSGWVRTSSLGSSAYCYNVDYQYSGGAWAYDSALSAQQGIVLLTVYGYSSPGAALPPALTSGNVCGGTVPRGGVERAIQVRLRQQGFLDYAQLTDLNLVDPSLPNTRGTCANNPNSSVTYYDWSTPSGASECGGQINFWSTGMTVTGPVRSNDDYYICGNPFFNGPIISDDPKAGSKDWADPAGSCGTDDPVFNGVPYVPTGGGSAGAITHGTSMIDFPSTDSAAKAYAKQSGCYYVGPTSISISGSTMTVVSPMSTSTGPNATTAARCLQNPVPASGVVFVDATSGNCAGTFGTTLGWTGDTCSSNVTPGDVFISGQGFSSAMTVVAWNNIFIDGSLTDADMSASSPDVLGLVANNSILLTHAVQSNGNNVYGSEPFFLPPHKTCDGTLGAPYCIPTPAGWGTTDCNGNSSAPFCNIVIDAAMLSLQHTFSLQNYTSGKPWGQVQIDGALAEEFMDIEGTFNGTSCHYLIPTPVANPTSYQDAYLCSGINVTYTWDNRLAHMSPPHFLSPSNTQWTRLSYEECPVSTGCLT